MAGWLAFSLAALGLWGVWGFLSKVAAQQLPPPAVYAITILGHLAALGYLLAGPGLMIPWQPWGWAAALAAGVSMAFGLLCFLHALGGGAAAVVVPLTSLYPVLTVILSLIFLRETVSLRQGAGVACALAAVWLLAD